ncbi:ferrochelatase, partial [Clostridium perfringens]
HGRRRRPERVDEVAEHYHHFGGVAPINRLNREIIAALEAELREQGRELPIYWGNRNWHPMVEDTVARMADDGARNGSTRSPSTTTTSAGSRR